MDYYNEIEKSSAEWLKELIHEELIPDGKVDTRDIALVQPDDLKGFTQAHFFAGIGGWPLALKLAGWPSDRPVWTGSCPCQPFSLGGKNQGTKDPRDLWPVFSRLIRQSKPNVVFGEQVKDAIRWGWMDRLCDDLEAEDYSCGACVFSCGAIGGLHKIDRLYWGALRPDADGLRPQRQRKTTEKPWAWQQFKGLVHAELQSAIPSGSIGGLSDGVPERVGILWGFGNAIVPQVAARFVTSFAR